MKGINKVKTTRLHKMDTRWTQEKVSRENLLNLVVIKEAKQTQ